MSVTVSEKPAETGINADYSGSAGICLCPMLLMNFVTSIKDFFHSHRYNDNEALFEHLLTIIETPIGLVNAVEKLIILVSTLLLGIAAGTLVATAAIFGFLFCAIDAVIESLRLSRQISFGNFLNADKFFQETQQIDRLDTKELNTHIETLKNNKEILELLGGEKELTAALDEITQLEPNEKKNAVKALTVKNKLTQIHKAYLTLSDQEIQAISEKTLGNDEAMKNEQELQLETKKRVFARRVRPWMVDEFITSFKEISLKLESKDPMQIKEAINSGQDLIKSLDIQRKKALIVHGIGLLAISLAVVGTGLLFFTGPFAIPLIITLIGMAVEYARFLAPSTFLDSRGYSFTPSNCIPKWIKECCHA